MQTDPEKMSDAEVIRLAEAEREAGVPDLQTAKASAAAKQRVQNVEEPEAPPELTHCKTCQEITMNDTHDNAAGLESDTLLPTAADAVTYPAMAPMDDDAGAPTADKEQMNEPGEEEAAAQLGELS